MDRAGDKLPAGWRSGRFLVQPEQRRLWCDGTPVELEERALDLIVLLLRHRQRALDRQELISLLWGRRPVSDATLRQLVYKARRALGDDGEHQAMIRTLYGRSLQWVAPVEEVDQEPEGPRPVAPAAGSTPHLPDAVPAAGLPTVPAGPGRVGRRPGLARWLGGAAAVLAAVVLVIALTPRGEAPPAPPTPRLAIEPIDNQTGDGSLDWVQHGLPGLLASLVGQEGGVDVVEPVQVARAWDFKPQHGRTREQQLRFVTGADTLVGGALRRLGAQLWELRLTVRPASGRPTELSVTGSQPGVMAARAALLIRRKLTPVASRAVPSELPRDRFLAEAFARGSALSAQGKPTQAMAYFKLCAQGDPDFLPGRFQLALAQVGANEVKAGRQTLHDLLAAAEKSGDLRMRGRVLLWLGRLARDYANDGAALGYLQQALAAARRADDMETQIEAHLVTAIAAHTLGQRQLSARELSAGRALLAAHPGFRHAQGMLYDAQDLIALENGDAQAALAAARAGLALREANGEERGVVVGLNNVAVALRLGHRDGDAVRVVARAYQRAVKNHYLELEFDAGGNLALNLVTTGLPQSAVVLTERLVPVARELGSPSLEVMALQIRALAQIQQEDFKSAQASLQRADTVAGDPARLGYDAFLGQRLYEAMVAFRIDPAALPAIGRELDAAVRAHQHAGGDSPGGYVQRQQLVKALLAAVARKPQATLASLRAAAAAPPVDGDGDVEQRMVPLLVALASHDASAAAIALKGYDESLASDATVLHFYKKWALQQGDHAGWQRADARLEQLRATSRQSLADAGVELAAESPARAAAVSQVVPAALSSRR